MAELKDHKKTEGLVFQIQHYCIHDGPGIRTTVFLKGCPLSCSWCANPEGRSAKAQLLYASWKCTGCRLCVEKCPKGAVSPSGRHVVTDRAKCDGCGACTGVCRAKAREISGKQMTAEAVMEEVLTDTLFYDKDGGMTVSGGEALMQPEFTESLIILAKEAGIHTAVETCGFASRETVRRVLGAADMVLYDLKNIEDAAHKAGTQQGNLRILSNLKYLDEYLECNYCIRMPIIPGYNDGPGLLDETGGWIAENLKRYEYVEPLAYHKLGISKLQQLEVSQNAAEYPVPDEKEMEYVRDILRGRGIRVRTP